MGILLRVILPLFLLILSGCQIPKVYRGTDNLLPTCGYCPVVVIPAAQPITEDTAGTVLFTVTDSDSATLNGVTVATQGAKGNATACSAAAPTGNATIGYTYAVTCTYTPNANLNGTDSFVVDVTDGTGYTSSSTFTPANRAIPVNIAPVNDAPTITGAAVPKAFNSGAAQSFTLAQMGFTVNDPDTIAANGYTETFAFAATGLPAGFSIDPQTGTISGTGNGLGLTSPEVWNAIVITATDNGGQTLNKLAVNTPAETFNITDVTRPGNVSAIQQTGGTATSIVLGWTEPVDADYKGVIICRNATLATDPTCAGGVTVGNILKGTTTVTDTGLTSTVTYTYTLFSYDEVPNKSLGVTKTATPRVALTSGMNSSVVVGQADFITGTANTGGAISATGKNSPSGVWKVGGILYISEQNNNRVLGYNTQPTASGTAANFVLGQTNFITGTANTGGLSASSLSQPNAMHSDGTRLAVTDSTNNRVLIWNTLPTTTAAAASVVVGQANFISGAAACAQGGLANPTAVWFVNGKMLVADSVNHRVLIWNTIPTTNGALPDLVLGQPDFNSCLSNAGGTPSNTSFNNPYGVTSDGTMVAVADYSNQRVMIWTTFPTASNQAANLVLGQAGFTTATPGTTATTLSGPWMVTIAVGRMLVSDYGNNRVMVWDTLPTTNQQAANVVLGQANFTTATGGTTANTMKSPGQVYADSNNVITTEQFNNRALIFP
ncbi:MAG: putative Ig domain-containing protein [Deltaproteobacteria bacterium]|nr:putative Ig domain-containing protein [Deltaproteobacteria bacterium]